VGGNCYLGEERLRAGAGTVEWAYVEFHEKGKKFLCGKDH